MPMKPGSQPRSRRNESYLEDELFPFEQAALFALRHGLPSRHYLLAALACPETPCDPCQSPEGFVFLVSTKTSITVLFLVVA